MRKHLEKFNTQEQIQSALNDGSLLKPYVALYNNETNIDYDSKEIVPLNMFANISVSNDIEYTFDADIAYACTAIQVSNFNYVKVNSIPQNIKNYILNGNHNRWFVLETPILLHSLSSVQTSYSGDTLTLEINYDDNRPEDYNRIKSVKYDETTQTLYLSRGDFYKYDEFIYHEDEVKNQLFPNLAYYNELEYSSNYNGLKIFYDNSVNDFVITGAQITNVETNGYTNGYTTFDFTLAQNEWTDMYFINSYIIDIIEDYLNNNWDGSLQTLPTNKYTNDRFHVTNPNTAVLVGTFNNFYIATPDNDSCSNSPIINDEGITALVIKEESSSGSIYINIATLKVMYIGQATEC